MWEQFLFAFLPRVHINKKHGDDLQEILTRLAVPCVFAFDCHCGLPDPQGATDEKANCYESMLKMGRVWTSCFFSELLLVDKTKLNTVTVGLYHKADKYAQKCLKDILRKYPELIKNRLIECKHTLQLIESIPIWLTDSTVCPDPI